MDPFRRDFIQRNFEDENFGNLRNNPFMQRHDAQFPPPIDFFQDPMFMRNPFDRENRLEDPYYRQFNIDPNMPYDNASQDAVARYLRHQQPATTQEVVNDRLLEQMPVTLIIVEEKKAEAKEKLKRQASSKYSPSSSQEEAEEGSGEHIEQQPSQQQQQQQNPSQFNFGSFFANFNPLSSQNRQNSVPQNNNEASVQQLAEQLLQSLDNNFIQSLQIQGNGSPRANQQQQQPPV